MRVHFDILGWLYILSGIFAELIGFSLGVLAFGTDRGSANVGVPGPAALPTVWFLLISGALAGLGGLLMILAGRAIVGRRRGGRTAALMLAAFNLLIVPFGTALGIYTYWVLLNDDARRAFGRPALAQ